MVDRYEQENLLTPGPTPLPRAVRDAMTRQMINHRGPRFKPILLEVTDKLKTHFQTKNDVLIFPSSGTGGWEAVLVNTLSAGDKVLSIIVGEFGQRFADAADAFGLNVQRLEFEWGTAADPDAVRAALAAAPDTKAVLVTHNETSTGVTNSLESIARVVKSVNPDVLLLVDAVSAMGAIDVQTDAWDLDVVFTGSQKAWMIPPGLMMVAVGPKAWAANKTAGLPRYYFDFDRAKKSLDKGETPYTPAISLFYALQAALTLMDDEGRESIYARHKRVADQTRQGVKALGLELFADPKFASNTVTSVRVPQGVDGKALLKILREEYGVVLAGGQAKLADTIFRIGHLGAIEESDIVGALNALRQALPKVGFVAEKEAMVS